jgi:hypothetical protein
LEGWLLVVGEAVNAVFHDRDDAQRKTTEKILAWLDGPFADGSAPTKKLFLLRRQVHSQTSAVPQIQQAITVSTKR